MSSWFTMIISCFVLSDFPHSHSSALQSIVSILLWDYISIYSESTPTCCTSLHPSFHLTQLYKSSSPELITSPEYSIVHDRVSFLTQQVLPPYKSCSIYLPMVEQPESLFSASSLAAFPPEHMELSQHLYGPESQSQTLVFPRLSLSTDRETRLTSLRDLWSYSNADE